MKILAVSQFYTPDITAAAFRIAETVDDLKDMGNTVEVVTTFPHKSESKEKTEKSKGGIHRVHLPATENKGFLGYIYLYLSFLIKAVVRGFFVGRKLKPGIIWASSPPIFVGLAGWALSKVLRAKFALDIRDIWPDSAVAAGQISGKGLAYSVGRKLEMFLYKKADVISCVANPMKDYIKSFTETEVQVVYNGVEVDTLDNKSIDIDTLKEFSTDSESKKILYAGNFGHVQQLDLLINAFANLNGTDLKQSWEIFFLGGGAKKDHLKELVEENQLDNIYFLDPVSKEQVFSYLKSADVLFIHLQDSEVLRLTIPSKVFDYMLADRPLLAGIQGEGKKIIDSVEGNFTFTPGDEHSLKAALLSLDKNITENKNPDNASKVKANYSRNSQSKKLNKILKKISVN